MYILTSDVLIVNDQYCLNVETNENAASQPEVTLQWHIYVLLVLVIDNQLAISIYCIDTIYTSYNAAP